MRTETLEFVGGPRDGEVVEVPEGSDHFDLEMCSGLPTAFRADDYLLPTAPSIRIGRYVRSSLWRGLGKGKPPQKIADVFKWEGER